MKKIKGTVAAAALAVSCIGTCAVYAADNHIINGDFSQGGIGWHGDGIGSVSVTYENGLSTISSTGSDYECRKYQTVELPNGIYTLTAKAAVSDIEGIYYIYAKTAGHTMASTSIPQSAAVQTVTVPGIVVEDGKCDVGIYAKGSAAVTLADIALTESTDTATGVPFLKGGEISKLTYVEDMGGRFYRDDGTEADALQIMAENGFNLARVRILNDPGKGHGDGYYYLPAGYQNETDCLELCRRAKDKGMQIEFTFAYSDYWVDGDKQFIPHEWQEYIDANNLTGTKKYEYLENKVYEYTKDIMQKLIAQGTCPEYVSIGNEMQCGMFFGDAKKNDYKGELYYDKAWLTRFVNAGARAVRETAPETKVVIHTDNGGKVFNWLNTNWDSTAFQYLLKRADYDVMAVSYYPFYNGDISIDNIVTEFSKCVNDLGKDVMIMESGYNFAEKRSDGYEGQLMNNGYYQNSYGETQNGQRAYLTELYSKLKQVAGGRCIGVSYWDPIMITDKVGWAISEDGDRLQANVITNSAIFDFDGKAAAGQLAMKYNTNASDKVLLIGKAEPNTETVLTIDGTEMTVKADKFGDYIAAADYPSDGRFDISADGIDFTVDAPYNGVLAGLEIPKDVYLCDLSYAKGKASASFTVNKNSENEVIGMLVKYDTNGILTGVKTVTFTPNISKTVSAEVDVGNKDVFIKSFMWQAEDMAPLVSAGTLTLE